MAATRDEIREHLIAVMEAAQELPKEDRHYLADSFLDELDRQFRLESRTPGNDPEGARRANDSRYMRPTLAWWRAPFLLLPVLLLLFVAVHPPILLLALFLFVLFRFGGLGVSARSGWRRAPRRRAMRHIL